MTEREWQIRQLLRGYRVQLHYEASRTAPGSTSRAPLRYALFIDGVQATEPADHATARHAREDHLVAAIVKLFEET